jgi:hypothetical protein
MVRPQVEVMAVSPHRRFLTLVDEIERDFPVSRWKCGDVEIWPLARMDLYLDMHFAQVGGPSPVLPPFPLRAIARAATPLANLWKSRRDLAHWVVRPKPAYAIFLGDGVSLDLVDDEWQDRFGEPLMVDLEKRGLRTFLMQSGALTRLPWHRPTFAANTVAVWGALTASATARPVELPGHEQVLQFLARNDVPAPSLSRVKLERRARVVFATASAFEWVLLRVKPTLAFVVTYYAGLGAAFLVACRRQGILSIDLQHCPQDGAHKAYRWSALPDNGYATLPALFWNWTEHDAANIRSWASGLDYPWHRSVHGGHTQIASFLDDSDPRTKAWDAKVNAVGNGQRFEREILVALQPIGGRRAQWEALGKQIEAAPSRWRWWIRRHPASGPSQDDEYRHLLSLRRPNVVVSEASSTPLPALLRHMNLVLSLASGASWEAAAFGVPAFFLSDEASGPFAGLIDRGLASIIDVQTLHVEIARLPVTPVRPAPVRGPSLGETLLDLDKIAREYSQLCRNAAGAAGTK